MTPFTQKPPTTSVAGYAVLQHLRCLPPRKLAAGHRALIDRPPPSCNEIGPSIASSFLARASNKKIAS